MFWEDVKPTTGDKSRFFLFKLPTLLGKQRQALSAPFNPHRYNNDGDNYGWFSVIVGTKLITYSQRATQVWYVFGYCRYEINNYSQAAA